MRVRYTFHALERIRQRGIEKKLITLCIREPDKSEQLEEVRKCVKRIDDKVIIVVYREGHDEILVITAYLSSKIHKYLAES